jgi:uncharacterized protein
MNMKLRFILLLLAFQIYAALCSGQKKFIGLWEGKIKAGAVDLRMVINFSMDENNNLKAVLEMPDHQTTLAANELTVSGDTAVARFREAKAVYEGVLQGDSTIKGVWKQVTVRLPLDLKKVDKITFPPRPQTPTPPFSYKSEDIEYFNSDNSIKYAGTITIPPGKGPFPAAILITGSGQQDRDETMMGHKTFAVIADHLTKQGFIILRVDDRGVGGTTGDAKNATTADFAKDVMVGLDYLKKRPEVNAKKIGMIGHSEGGMIAAMIGAERKDIDFIVLLAAPGIKITELMVEQNRAVFTKSGLPEKSVSAYAALYRKLIETIITSDTAQVKENLTAVVDKWRDTTDKAAVVSTTGIFNTNTRDEFVNQFAGLAANPWFSYFFRFDPTPYLEKLSSKVLALNGAQDVQVLSASNLAGIRTALQKSKAKTVDIVELPGMNHLFQTCKDCSVIEYSKLEETFSPIALQKMSEWLKKNVQ